MFLRLEWAFGLWDLYYDDVIADGSCFFHALLYICSKYYHKLNIKDKHSFARAFRKELSQQLPKYYDKLSRGQLKSLSKDIPELRLPYMISELNSDLWIGQSYLEYISVILGIDIYILDNSKKRVYIMGDDSIYYKHAPSIVLLYRQHHFQVISLKRKHKFVTIFRPNDPFIEDIRNQINYLLSLGSITPGF